MPDQTLALDADAIRRKYAEERDKRFRAEQNAQWAELDERFAHLSEDPYVEPGFTRDPIVEDIDALVIGGGFGGMIAAVELQKRGIENIRIVEKAGDFGGTWYWNRYPGAQCDTESYIYLPYLEETGYIPTEKYVFAPEMLEHSQRIATHFGLYDKALFQTQVLEMAWDEASRRWNVATNRDDVLRARHVIYCSGPLNRVKLPGVLGLKTFKGKVFHTSRWDYDYTGGSTDTPMTRLHDKRVAVIGTGATAIQCVPRLAEDAQHLYVVQRTPSVVGERGNCPTDMDWAASLEAGWQRERSTNFESHVIGQSNEPDLVSDGWTVLNRSIRPQPSSEPRIPEDLAREGELRDFAAGEKIRARIDATVTDPATAEALKPWYRIYCKRPTFNDEYYPAFNLPNVTLLDTQGAGLERLTETGIVACGTEYEVDCIIFATGFETGSEYTKRSEFEVRGVGGRTLTEHFRKGPLTLHGFYAHGFPNFFILGNSQNAFTASFTHMLLDQGQHICDMIAMMQERGLTRLEPEEQAVEDWQHVVRESVEPRKLFLASCTPGYYNGYGEVDAGLFTSSYSGGFIAFNAIMDAWRSKEDFAGLELS